MNRRDLLHAFGLLLIARRVDAASVSTIIGTGAPGYSNREVNNPYGVVVRGGALYFCDLDNQRIRRMDLRTRQTSTIAGSGERGYSGDGGPATAASLNMPHEIQFDRAGNLFIVERDNHAVRRVDARRGVISTVSGTGTAGFSGDGGPAAKAQLRSPHSIAFAPDGALLICDVGNHRIRRLDMGSGTIATYAGTGAREATPDGARLEGTPLNGPRTMAFDERGTLYLVLREGNAIYRVPAKQARFEHVAGTGASGYSGDNGPAKTATFAGPKGLAYVRGRLYVADTENHVIRLIDLRTGTITTVLGDGQRGDGPETDPLKCRLNRPHGVCVDASGALFVGDSEAHRIRVVWA
jgi:sugar lactone lactonase YvrE